MLNKAILLTAIWLGTCSAVGAALLAAQGQWVYGAGALLFSFLSCAVGGGIEPAKKLAVTRFP